MLNSNHNPKSPTKTLPEAIQPRAGLREFRAIETAIAKSLYIEILAGKIPVKGTNFAKAACDLAAVLGAEFADRGWIEVCASSWRG